MFRVFIKYIEFGGNVLKHLMEVVEIYLISDMIVKKKDLKVCIFRSNGKLIPLQTVNVFPDKRKTFLLQPVRRYTLFHGALDMSLFHM